MPSVGADRDKGGSALVHDPDEVVAEEGEVGRQVLMVQLGCEPGRGDASLPIWYIIWGLPPSPTECNSPRNEVSTGQSSESGEVI